MNETSLRYQERFAAAVPDQVVGRSLDEPVIGVLADASGSADGFNDSIAKISASGYAVVRRGAALRL